VTPCSESSLLQIVATRPVATAIDGACDTFINYGGGIYSTDCGSGLNHAVTVVGEAKGGGGGRGGCVLFSGKDTRPPLGVRLRPKGSLLQWGEVFFSYMFQSTVCEMMDASEGRAD
jgi:hypothetical protein